MKRIIGLSNHKLGLLRKQVVLNSVFEEDYSNNLGIDAGTSCVFFESYLEHLMDKYGFTGTDILEFIKEYDTIDELVEFRDLLDSEDYE